MSNMTSRRKQRDATGVTSFMKSATPQCDTQRFHSKWNQWCHKALRHTPHNAVWSCANRVATPACWMKDPDLHPSLPTSSAQLKMTLQSTSFYVTLSSHPDLTPTAVRRRIITTVCVSLRQRAVTKRERATRNLPPAMLHANKHGNISAIRSWEIWQKWCHEKWPTVFQTRRRLGFTSAHLCAATSPDCTEHYWDIHIYESMFAGVRRWLTRTPASLSCLLVLKTVRPWLSEGGKYRHDRKEFYPSSGSSNRYQRDSKCDKNEFGIIRSENWP